MSLRSMITAIVLLLATVSAAAAQPAATVPDARPRPTGRDPGLYLHVGFGFGGGVQQSTLAEALLNDEFSIKPSGVVTALVRTGIRNIVQAEYRTTDGGYSFKNEFPAGGRLGAFESIKMDYDTSEWLIKLNPLAVLLPRNTAIFAVAGRGTTAWRDESNDGFRGNSWGSTGEWVGSSWAGALGRRGQAGGLPGIAVRRGPTKRLGARPTRPLLT